MNQYDWYLTKDVVRTPPKNEKELVKRSKSLDLRWDTWDQHNYDPLRSHRHIKNKFFKYQPDQDPNLTLKIPGLKWLSSEKNKENILMKISRQKDFLDRVKRRTLKRLQGKETHHDHHHNQPRKTGLFYWQRRDRYTGDITSKSYNHLMAQNRAYEMSRLKGDERWFYLVEIQFSQDNCEFTPLYRHIMKTRRKWRKEPRIWRTIPWDEIKMHRFVNDCWTVVKGRVYDITTFLNVHSGGSVPLRQVFGKDGTWVLMGVHPYVVWYNYMRDIEIGHKPKYHKWGWVNYEPIHQFDGMDYFCEWIKKKPHPLRDFYPLETMGHDKTNIYYSVEFKAATNTTTNDWMFSVRDRRYLRIQFHIQGTDIWYGDLKLPVKLKDDIPYWIFSEKNNKCSFTFEKPTVAKKTPSKKIKKMDYHGMFFSTNTLEYEWYDAYILRKAYLAADVILITVGYDMNAYLGVPVGHYVNFEIEGVIRPFTPIVFPIVRNPKKKIKIRTPGTRGTMTFVIRLNSLGAMGPLLLDTPKDKGDRHTELKISPARGIFDMEFMHTDMDTMLIIAAGTGIAPFTRIIQTYRDMVKKGTLKNKHVVLMYFNKAETDIVFGKTFAWLNRVENKWFHYYPVLTRAASKPVKNWKGLEGHPTKDLIMKCLKHTKGVYTPTKKLKIMICGRYNFIHWVELELAELKLTDIKNQFAFLGST